MGQTNKTIHTCIFYKEHVPMSRKIYGACRVNQQLENPVKYCNGCDMLLDLCQYVGLKAKREVEREYNDYVLDYQNMPICDSDGHIIGVKPDIVYRETLLSIDEFFEPPEDGKRWIDFL